MSKFNHGTVAPARGRGPIVAQPTPTARTHEGGAGYVRDAKSQLFMLAVVNTVGEDTFYETGAQRDDRYERLISQVTLADPEWIGGFLRWLRGDANMRSASLVGALIAARAVRVVDRAVPVQEFGFVAREALAQSRTDVSMVNFRDPAQSPITPLLAAAGVKSYDGYARSMRACFVDLDDGWPGFLIRPTRNESRNGLVDLPHAQVRLPATATDGEVGEAVLQGVTRSIGRPPSVRRGSRAARVEA